MDELINNINPAKKSPSKEQLWGFIKESLKQIGQINENYKKFFKGTEDKEAIIQNIENKYQKINEDYNNLFSENEQGISKIKELYNKVEEIKKFHQELLTDSDEEDSIKTDIEDSKKHITKFYNFLFGSEENEQTNEGKIKESIEKITKFEGKIFNEKEGLEKIIDNAYQNITNKYSELFEAEEGKKSKVKQLDENIEKINLFNASLDDEIKLNLDKKQKYLDDLKVDIDTKRNDIKSLLTSATLGALTQGYQESKEEYSSRGKIKYREADKIISKIINIPYNFVVFIYNFFFRYGTNILNYIIFIFPLFLILIFFIQPKWTILENFNNLLKSLNGANFDNYLLFRVALSLPLLWISWFGQKNISQRKRLFEEYNHKLRVVQMYRMFSDNDKSYNLENKIKLERILLNVIEKNPAEHLGGGETMVDKILEKFRVKGFYGELKDEVIKDLRPVKKKNL